MLPICQNLKLQDTILYLVYEGSLSSYYNILKSYKTQTAKLLNIIHANTLLLIL